MEESALDLADIQGFILRGYRMPMVRHFLLTIGIPAQARRQLGRLVSGDESDAPQIIAAVDWHVGFAPGPGDNPTDARVASPIIASTSVSLGPDWLRWRQKNASRHYLSSDLVRSSKEPRNERSWSEITEQVLPKTGLTVFAFCDSYDCRDFRNWDNR
jgi:hypothetical protein